MADLERWVWFATVAEELSFSKAARRLRVDQPWLSRQIQQLETQVGFPLFARNTRNVVLTREGESMLEFAQELAEVSRTAREQMRSLKRDMNAQVLFGYNPHVYWIRARRELIAQFTSAHGENSLKLSSNYTPRLLHKLADRAIDFALVPLPSPLVEMEAIVLNRSTAMLLAPSEDPLAQRSSVHLAELAGRKIVTTDPRLNPASYEKTYAPFFSAGAEPVISPEGQVALSYYAASHRYLLVSTGWPDNEDEIPADFIPVRILDPLPPVEHGLVRRAEPGSELAQAFWKLAQELAPKPS